MGRHKINEEEKVQGLMINIKGYILDNINNDPNSMKEIQSFIESKWGSRDIKKYDDQRKEKRIASLNRAIEDKKRFLFDIEKKHGVNSEVYKMMGPPAARKIEEAESELISLVEDGNEM